MIHHLSIPATDTQHVADVLVELLDGTLTPFGPYPNSWIAWVGDDHGAAIEVYPVGTELYPDPRGTGQAHFRHNPDATPFTATHATVSVDRTVEEVLAIAARESWTAIPRPIRRHRVLGRERRHARGHDSRDGRRLPRSRAASNTARLRKSGVFRHRCGST